MSLCPNCAAAMPQAFTRCPQCGADAINVVTTLAPPDTDETRLSAGSDAPRTPSEVSDRGFVPGRVLARRYRIVALLGRGGMGEVYRADDLKLGQPVALKFLPRVLAADPDVQERLLDEVRVARDVSHPNVCRVYDVVEADGDQFIAMEYIDGEDLASLLRRIGRLPADKAADIARQLCAGLAAIHDKGLLHRDLKPANVMLDGRGRVRVMDFGLAVDAGRAGERREIAGTPAYMAPEQLVAGKLSPRTDVYALGLILFEILTGRRFFPQGPGDPPSDRSDFDSVKRHASDATLDPVIERVVVRCLDPNPSHRPESALQVAAALPGGNPLEAALAAGETPSPAVVAAAGEGPSLSPTMALGALLSVLVLLGPIAWWRAHDSAFARLQPPFSRDVLEFKAREMLARLGYDRAERLQASSFEFNEEYTRAQRKRLPVADRWTTLATDIPSPVTFWVRFSRPPLVPREFGASGVTRTDPASTVPGMKTVVVDTRGRLVSLAVQPQMGAPLSTPITWSALFAEAGLDIAAFKPVGSATLPTAWGDAMGAWVGLGGPGGPAGMFVEAASYGGRPTFFAMLPAVPQATSAASPTPPGPGAIASGVSVIAIVLGVVGGALKLARSNYRSGRADLRGARRVAGFFVVSEFIVRVVAVSNPLQLLSAYALNAAATAGGIGLLIWVLYLALEPQIRRSLPEALVGWNRVLEGRVFDARVGNDILAGVALRIVSLPVGIGLSLVSPPFSGPVGAETSQWVAAMSARHAIASTIAIVNSAVLAALLLLLLLSFAWLAARRQWRTMVVFALVFAFLGAIMGRDVGGSFRDALVGAISVGFEATLVLVVVARFGIIGLVAFMASDFLSSNVHTLQPSAWYYGSSLLSIAVIAALTFYGYRQVLRARSLTSAAPR